MGHIWLLRKNPILGNKDKVVQLKLSHCYNEGTPTNEYFTKKKYQVLFNKTCPYAAQVFEGGGVFKMVCKINLVDYNKLVRKR